MISAMSISFRPLALSDIDDLFVWLNRPHLRRFFQKQPISRDEVEVKYGPGFAATIRPIVILRSPTVGLSVIFNAIAFPTIPSGRH